MRWMTMDTKKNEQYRQKLLEIRNQLVGDVEKSRKYSKEEVSGDVPDINDEASRTYSRQVILHLGEKERKQLKEVDLCLERIENDEYGECIECRGEIPQKRLESIPYTMHCVKCKELAESQEPDENDDVVEGEAGEE
jgi:DnaK suppressor protein